MNKILNYFAEEGVKRTVSRVEAALASGKEDVEKLVQAFLEGGRFERAKELVDKVVIEETGEEVVKAKVKDYHITVDIKGRRLRHDCDDWSKRVEQKQFCKHVAAFFLALDRRESEKILENISNNIKDWVFETQ